MYYQQFDRSKGLWIINEFWIIYIGDLFHTNMYNFHTNDLKWKTIRCNLVCQVYLTKQTGWKFKTQPKKLTNV